ECNLPASHFAGSSPAALRSLRGATSVFLNKSNGPNPKAAQDVPPIGRPGRCKNESPQRFHRHKAGRDRTRKLWHRPPHNISRRCKSEKTSLPASTRCVYRPDVFRHLVI